MVPMDQNSLKHVLLFLIVALFSSCSFLKPKTEITEETDIQLEKLQALLNNYKRGDDNCLEILAIAKQYDQYLPSGSKYNDLSYCAASFIPFSILECVYNMASENAEAESILLDYFKAEYEVIQQRGHFNEITVFSYLGNNNSKETLDFFFLLAQDNSENRYNRHGHPPLTTLQRFGQGNILARIQSIDGKPFDEYNYFKSERIRYMNLPYVRKRRRSGKEYDNVDRWNVVYLPKIDKAIKENRLEFKKLFIEHSN